MRNPDLNWLVFLPVFGGLQQTPLMSCTPAGCAGVRDDTSACSGPSWRVHRPKTKTRAGSNLEASPWFKALMNAWSVGVAGCEKSRGTWLAWAHTSALPWTRTWGHCLPPDRSGYPVLQCGPLQGAYPILPGNPAVHLYRRTHTTKVIHYR